MAEEWEDDNDSDSELEDDQQEDEKLVTVATYQFVHQAEAMKMHLEGEGIPAYIADAETVTMDWLLGNAIGNIKLQVAASQADHAQAVLGRHQPRVSQEPADEDDEETEVTTCLSCGKEMPEDATSCPACGWSYTDEGFFSKP